MPDTSEHADRAEVLLSLVGEPVGRSEMLLAAQTHAIIALVHTLRPPVDTRTTGIPQAVMNVAVSWTSDPTQVRSVMRLIEHNLPNWRTNKIQAIKEHRRLTIASLKESKDFIEAVASTSPPQWW